MSVSTGRPDFTAPQQVWDGLRDTLKSRVSAAGKNAPKKLRDAYRQVADARKEWLASEHRPNQARVEEETMEGVCDPDDAVLGGYLTLLLGCCLKYELAAKARQAGAGGVGSSPGYYR